MRVPLAAVTNNRDLLVGDDREIGVVFVEQVGHEGSLQEVLAPETYRRLALSRSGGSGMAGSCGVRLGRSLVAAFRRTQRPVCDRARTPSDRDHAGLHELFDAE